MACRRITVGDGVQARCLRLGFVGELSYELHAPSQLLQVPVGHPHGGRRRPRHPPVRPGGPVLPARREGAHHHRGRIRGARHPHRHRHGLDVGPRRHRIEEGWRSRFARLRKAAGPHEAGGLPGGRRAGVSPATASPPATGRWSSPTARSSATFAPRAAARRSGGSTEWRSCATGMPRWVPPSLSMKKRSRGRGRRFPPR